MFLAKVYITLKPTVSDPQGRTVMGGLKSLGFDTGSAVLAGKYLEVKLLETDQSEAEKQVKDMCDKLLANPIIEEYRFELEEVPG